jgi:hypothetical protein
MLTPSVRPFEGTSRDQLDNLGVGQETERPGGPDVGVHRTLLDTICVGPAVREFALGAESERSDLLEQPGALLDGVHRPYLLPAGEFVPLMVQGGCELVVRDDHGIEEDVERARGGVEGHADDAGQVLELEAGPRAEGGFRLRARLPVAT